jgi:hypothetical protein
MTCWKPLWQRHFLDFGPVCANVGFRGNVPENAMISRRPSTRAMRGNSQPIILR